MILVQCSRNTIFENFEMSLFVQIIGLKIYLDVENLFQTLFLLKDLVEMGGVGGQVMELQLKITK
jgi:hypothetical protein